MADVIVCTPVVGAGFSINVRFQNFHAFLFNMILPHEEELQFIRRLRFILETITMNANRESFMFIAGNRGIQNEFSMVKKDYKIVRSILNKIQSLPTIATLEDTQARVQMEWTESFARHLDLWKEYGDNILTRRFEEMIDDDAPTKAQSKQYHETFKAYIKTRTRAVCDMIIKAEMDDVASILAQLEFGMGMETILTSWKDGQTETLEKAFNCQEVVMYIIKKKCPRREDIERLIGKPKNTSRYVRRLHAMTTWITYVYREIAPEQMNSIWKHIAQRQFNTVSLKNTAHLILCEYILQPFICTLCDTTIPYVHSPGSTPFFSGADFVQHKFLCVLLRQDLEAVHDDSDEIREQKSFITVV